MCLSLCLYVCQQRHITWKQLFVSSSHLKSRFRVTCRCLTLCFSVDTWEDTTKHLVSLLSFKMSVHCVFWQTSAVLSQWLGNVCQTGWNALAHSVFTYYLLIFPYKCTACFLPPTLLHLVKYILLNPVCALLCAVEKREKKKRAGAVLRDRRWIRDMKCYFLIVSQQLSTNTHH